MSARLPYQDVGFTNSAGFNLSETVSAFGLRLRKYKVMLMVLLSQV